MAQHDGTTGAGQQQTTTTTTMPPPIDFETPIRETDYLFNLFSSSVDVWGISVESWRRVILRHMTQIAMLSRYELKLQHTADLVVTQLVDKARRSASAFAEVSQVIDLDAAEHLPFEFRRTVGPLSLGIDNAADDEGGDVVEAINGEAKKEPNEISGGKRRGRKPLLQHRQQQQAVAKPVAKRASKLSAEMMKVKQEHIEEDEEEDDADVIPIEEEGERKQFIKEEQEEEDVSDVLLPAEDCDGIEVQHEEARLHDATDVNSPTPKSDQRVVDEVRFSSSSLLGTQTQQELASYHREHSASASSAATATRPKSGTGSPLSQKQQQQFSTAGVVPHNSSNTSLLGDETQAELISYHREQSVSSKSRGGAEEKQNNNNKEEIDSGRGGAEKDNEKRKDNGNEEGGEIDDGFTQQQEEEEQEPTTVGGGGESAVTNENGDDDEPKLSEVSQKLNMDDDDDKKEEIPDKTEISAEAKDETKKKTKEDPYQLTPELDSSSSGGVPSGSDKGTIEVVMSQQQQKSAPQQSQSFVSSLVSRVAFRFSGRGRAERIELVQPSQEQPAVTSRLSTTNAVNMDEQQQKNLQDSPTPRLSQQEETSILFASQQQQQQQKQPPSHSSVNVGSSANTTTTTTTRTDGTTTTTNTSSVVFLGEIDLDEVRARRNAPDDDVQYHDEDPVAVQNLTALSSSTAQTPLSPVVGEQRTQTQKEEPTRGGYTPSTFLNDLMHADDDDDDDDDDLKAEKELEALKSQLANLDPEDEAALAAERFEDEEEDDSITPRQPKRKRARFSTHHVTDDYCEDTEGAAQDDDALLLGFASPAVKPPPGALLLCDRRISLPGLGEGNKKEEGNNNNGDNIANDKRSAKSITTKRNRGESMRQNQNHPRRLMSEGTARQNSVLFQHGWSDVPFSNEYFLSKCCCVSPAASSASSAGPAPSLEHASIAQLLAGFRWVSGEILSVSGQKEQLAQCIVETVGFMSSMLNDNRR